MNPELQDFGEPDFFEPEAIGVPGNRRFRVIAGSRGRTAALWMERDQLQAFTSSLQQVLAQITGEDILRPAFEEPAPPPPPRADFPEDPDLELQAGPIALAYDEEDDRVVVLMAPVEIIEVDGTPVLNEDADPEFRATLTQTGVETFIGLAERVIAAGRPRCPDCGTALNFPGEPHGCIKQNGHRHLELQQ